MEDLLEGTSKGSSPSPQSVPFTLNLLFGQAPKQVRNNLCTSFKSFSNVLLRQKQLSNTCFTCDLNSDLIGSEVLFEKLCSHLNLSREDVDPDRLIWLPLESLVRFFIRPGQWVSLARVSPTKSRQTNNSESSSDNDKEFKCQVFPLLLSSSKTSVNPSSRTKILINPVAEYNLKKTLNIPQVVAVPPLRIKPLLTDPVIKSGDDEGPSSFAPSSHSISMQGKVVKLTRLKSSTGIDPKELDILIEDLFALNCKYLCVGDLISLPASKSATRDSRVDLLVSEINEKKVDSVDEFNVSKEVFKVSKEFSSVSLNSFEAHNQFHVRCGDEINAMQMILAPCLMTSFKKVYGYLRQALLSQAIASTSRPDIPGNLLDPALWPHILIHGPVGCGKLVICEAVAAAFGLNFYFLNGANFIGDTSAYTEGKLRAVFDKVRNSLCPALVYLKNVHLIGKDKDRDEDKRVIIAFQEFIHDFSALSTDSSPSTKPGVMTSRAVFVVGSTDSPEALLPSVAQNFLVKVEVPQVVKALDVMESTLKWLLTRSGAGLENGVDLGKWVKNNCEGMQRSLGDLEALAATAVRNAFRKLNHQPQEDSKEGRGKLMVSLDDLNFGLITIDTVLKKAASTVEVPKVSWEDIGGLEDVKKELINSVKLPLEFPHLFSAGVRRSGILLYGPPGTGKTLIAKAVATEFKLSFLSVKGPELLNMYVGQSEENVRDVFTKARNAAPCIIFFDELDALAPNRGRAGDSGGVMDRVVSQILAELDGTHSTVDVFVIGATNRPDLIDPALLRPGRFDKLLYVGVSQDNESKTKVLRALTRKFNLSEDIDLSEIAKALPEGMSGADLYSLCSDAYMTAIERNISSISNSIEESEPPNSEESILVKKCDFEQAASRATASLSGMERSKYEEMKELNR